MLNSCYARALRTPKQDRATKRRESILDAAASLLESRGYEGVTTNALAKEAAASIGTVYQYFPNKEAVLLALLERYRERLGAALLPALAQATLDATLESLIRRFAEFYDHEPGYAQLWLGTQLVGPLRDAGAEWGESFSAAFGVALADRAGLDAGAARLKAKVLVHAVSSVITLAASGDPDADALIEEAIELARRYLE